MPALDPPSRSQLRHGRRTRVWGAVAAVGLLAVAATGGVIAVSGGGGSPTKARAASPVESEAAPVGGESVEWPSGVTPLRAAISKGNPVPVFDKPDASAAPVMTLSAITTYDAQRSFLAFDQFKDWLH